MDDGFCDFAFGFAQNDKVEGILRRVKVFRSENLTKRKSGAMCIVLWLMLCTLVLDWFMLLALNKSGSYRAVYRCIL